MKSLSVCLTCMYIHMYTSYDKILCRIDPLLGNDFVNTFLRKRTLATIGRQLLGNESVNKLY
jgi:hypothetical protein